MSDLIQLWVHKFTIERPAAWCMGLYSLMQNLLMNLFTIPEAAIHVRSCHGREECETLTGSKLTKATELLIILIAKKSGLETLFKILFKTV